MGSNTPQQNTPNNSSRSGFATFSGGASSLLGKGSDKERIEALERELEEVKALLGKHIHNKVDGTSYLTDTQDIDAFQEYRVGLVASLSGAPQTLFGLEITRAVLTAGRDVNPQDGYDATQLTIEHQDYSNGTTNQSFFYGLRAPIYVGVEGTVVSGASTLTQGKYNWGVNDLIGAVVNVTKGDGTATYFGTITSNTKHTATLDTSSSFSDKACAWTIHVPVYLGSGGQPWRRVYTTEGTAGGIRIGLGTTNDGNNGLLYMNAAGDLYWRKKSGSSTKLN